MAKNKANRQNSSDIPIDGNSLEASLFAKKPPVKGFKIAKDKPNRGSTSTRKYTLNCERKMIQFKKNFRKHFIE